MMKNNADVICQYIYITMCIKNDYEQKKKEDIGYKYYVMQIKVYAQR